MAKKKNKDNKIDGDLDFDDLDDLDSDGMDFGDIEDIDAEGREPSKTEIAKELTKEAGSGFLSSLVSKTAEKTLPDEYSNNYYEVMDYADYAKNTFDENKSKVNKSLYKLGIEVKKILPFQSKLLNNFLEKFETSYEQQRQVSEEEQRESSIQSNLAGIFDKQLEIQKAIEIKNSAEKQVENREKIVTNKLNIDILSNIDSNISNQTAFTLQISKEYYRKSLELQFKTYFIQSDMLKVIKDYYKGFSIQFDSIVKNTGLPEFVKLNESERVRDILKNKAIQSTYQKVFDKNKYVENIKKKFSGLVSDKVSGITDKIDNITDQLGMINMATESGGSSAGGLMGGVLANLFGSTLGEKLSDRISPKLKDKIKDNKYINSGANYLGTLANSPSTFFGGLKNKISKKQEEYQDESTIGRSLKNKLFGGLNDLLSVTTPESPDFKVSKSSILSHNQPAIFDNKVHRSITEVIPLYLSKILKENTDLKTLYYNVNKRVIEANKEKPYKESEELVYDYENRNLTDIGTYRDNIEKSVLASTSSKNKVAGTTSSMISKGLQELSKDKTKNKKDIDFLKNKKVEKLLSSYIERASKLEDIEFNYKTVIEQAASGKAPLSIKNLVDSDPNLQKALKLISLSATDNKELNAKLEDVKRKYPIEAVREILLVSSRLANNKAHAKIKEDILTTLSKIMTKRILSSNKDILIENIITGEFLNRASKEEFEKVKRTVTVFISDIKKINDINDMVTISKIEYVLSTLNRSLRDNVELNPEVFQTLHEADPRLIGTGKLTTENMVERKLGKGSSSSSELISTEDLRGVTRTSKRDVDNIRISNVENNVRSAFDIAADEAISDFKDAGLNPLKLLNATFKHSKRAIDKITQISKEKLKKSEKDIEELKKTLSDFVKDTSANSLNKVKNKLSTSINGINDLIKSEEKRLEEELAAANKAKEALTDTIDDKYLKEIERDKKLITIKYTTSIESLKKIKDILKSQKDNLDGIDVNNIPEPAELIKKLKKQLEETLEKLKSLKEDTKNQTSTATA